MNDAKNTQIIIANRLTGPMIHWLHFHFCSEKHKMFKVQKPAIGVPKGAEVADASD